MLRVNLLISILQAKPDEGGASLNLSLMLTKPSLKAPALLAAFPLHDYEMLKRLQLKWLNMYGPPWTQPVHDVKDYFGERIGLYFLYLQHYSTMLIVPAVVGAVAFSGNNFRTFRPFYFQNGFVLFVCFCSLLIFSLEQCDLF